MLHFDPEKDMTNEITNLDSAFRVKNVFISPKYTMKLWNFSV